MRARKTKTGRKTRNRKRLELHVALYGSDGNLGTREQPFATLERARNEIRRRTKTRSLPLSGIRVRLHEGTYYRSSPFVLTGRDSGTAKCPVVYEGQGDVRISGGIPVNNFKAVSDRSVLKRLPARARKYVLQADLKELGISNFGETVKVGERMEVFFKDKPMTLSRWPNDGFVTIADVSRKQRYTSHTIIGSKAPQFTYKGRRPERWTDEREVWLKGYWFWDWSDAYQKVKSIDTKRKRIRLTRPRHHYGYRPGQRYYALNLLSELDTPGEWYLDRKKRVLYFWPPSRVSKNACVISMTPTLISMRGTSSALFRNFTLEASRANAVEMRNVSDSEISECVIRNVGGWAVSIKGGENCRVCDGEIHDTGIGGVTISGGNRRKLIPANHAVVNNHIHHFSRIARTYSPAVLLGGVGHRIANNHIHDAPHTSILIGGNDHIIELNEIHHVCHETGDVGAFYMGRDWTMRGNIVRNNYFHHIEGPGLWGAQAVYLDDSASGTAIVGNVFYKTSIGAFIGGGRDNIVAGNIFAACPLAVHVDNRGLNWMRCHVQKGGTLPVRLAAMPYKNSLWRKRYPRLTGILDDEPGAPKGNIVRNNIVARSKFIDFSTDDRSLVKADNNLIGNSVGLVNLEKGRIRLRNASAASRAWVKKIPFDKIGVKK